MDKEDFQAWKDSPATQYVLGYLRSVATRVETGIKDRLFENSLASPDRWAALQVQASHEAGYVEALREFIELEHEDIAKSKQDRAY